jgi:hypothetical protein
MTHIYGDTQYASPADLIFRLLVDESGSNDMAANASSDPITFRYVVPEGHAALIERICIAILDASSVPSKWGGVSLTNGITFKVHDSSGTVICDFSDGEPIRSTAEMALLTGDAATVDTAAGIDQIGLRWELSRAGKPVILTSGQYFAAKLSDNYSGMDFFKIMVQGFYHVSP